MWNEGDDTHRQGLCETEISVQSQIQYSIHLTKPSLKEQNHP